MSTVVIQMAIGSASILALILSPLTVFAQEPTSSQMPPAATSVTRVKTASPTVQRAMKLELNVYMGGESLTDEQTQAHAVGAGVEGDLHLGLVRTLDFRLRGQMALSSGYAQTTLGDVQLKNGVFLKEAYLQFKPVNAFALQAGALDQGELEAPLLVSKRPFPGVAERLKIGNAFMSAELRAEQCVPTSSELTTKAVEAEPMPSFFTESLLLKVRPFEALELKASGTHYRYQSLPSAVAAESALYGNTLKSSEPGTERFLFEYEGFVASSGAKIHLTRTVSWGIDGQMIRNTKAEETYQNAQVLGTEFVVGLPGDVDLKPRAEMFFAESDVAPAFYNSVEYGHGNRQGWGAEVKATFRKEKFRIGARYVASDLINPSLEQSRQAYFIVRFESLYDVL
jgi:hypothetical protein